MQWWCTDINELHRAYNGCKWTMQWTPMHHTMAWFSQKFDVTVQQTNMNCCNWLSPRDAVHCMHHLVQSLQVNSTERCRCFVSASNEDSDIRTPSHNNMPSSPSSCIVVIDTSMKNALILALEKWKRKCRLRVVLGFLYTLATVQNTTDRMVSIMCGQSFQWPKCAQYGSSIWIYFNEKLAKFLSVLAAPWTQTALSTVVKWHNLCSYTTLHKTI